MNNKGSSLTPAQALEKLDALYEQSVNALRSAISDYIETGKLPDEKARTQGLFVYPSLSVTWDGTPAVTARPSRVLRCSAPTWKSSLPCCIRITARISALNRPCTRSLTRT